MNSISLMFSQAMWESLLYLHFQGRMWLNFVVLYGKYLLFELFVLINCIKHTRTDLT